MVPAAASTLQKPPSDISPTICSWADGHSLRTPGLKLITKLPVCS
jgi:hypothetical protein